MSLEPLAKEGRGRKVKLEWQHLISVYGKTLSPSGQKMSSQLGATPQKSKKGQEFSASEKWQVVQMMFEILSVMVLALASVNAEFKADCTDPCNCNGVSWEGKFTYP